MVAAERAQSVAPGRTPAFMPVGTVLAIAVIGIALFVVGQAFGWTLRRFRPDL